MLTIEKAFLALYLLGIAQIITATIVWLVLEPTGKSFVGQATVFLGRAGLAVLVGMILLVVSPLWPVLHAVEIVRGWHRIVFR